MTVVYKPFTALLAGLALVLLTVSVIGHAQTPEEKEKSKEHFSEGVTLYDGKKYAAALEEFNAAYSFYPHWKILYNIGMCYLELGDQPNAATKLSTFIEKGGEEINPEALKDVKKILDELRSKLGVIRLIGNYEGGMLLIDGNEKKRGGEGKDIFMKPGVHQVKFIRDDATVLDQKITIEAGEDREVFVKKYEPPEEETEKKPEEEEEAVGEEEKADIEPLDKGKKTNRGMSTAGWALLGIGLAAIVGGAVTGGLTFHEKNGLTDAEDEYIERQEASAPPAELDEIKSKRDDHYDRGMQYGIASTALLGAGAAAVVLTAILIPLSKKSGSAEKKTSLKPFISPQSTGLVLNF